MKMVSELSFVLWMGILIRNVGLIPESGRSPGGGHGNPLQCSSHGQWSLVGYSPHVHKESDTTEPLHMTFLTGFPCCY